MRTASDTEIGELKELILELDKKLGIYIAQTDEHFKSVENQLVAVKEQVNKLDERTEKQNNRYFGLLLSLIGFLISAFIAILVGFGKVILFPGP